MVTLLIAFALLLLGGLGAVALQARADIAQRLGQGGAVLGSLFGLAAAIAVLGGAMPAVLSLSWPMPGGGIHLAIDPLSAYFLLPVFGLSALAALYGRAYLSGRDNARAAAASWFYFNVLTAAMALVVVARDGLLFLLAWEIMALAPFFLVLLDDRREATRHAAWIYLAATHLGTAFLLVMFVLLGDRAGSSDFTAYAGALRGHPALASAVFLLVLIGFGSKAGIVPAHVWLPEAHPAAPSHVSALMSGAMIKIGIYGLLRMLTLLGPPPLWWGWTLLAAGAASGVLGVLYALAQHDLKRLLAYHSVENIGIILLGIGIGVLGLAYDVPVLAALGFAAGLLHVVNHSIFKALLFLGAGAVQHAAHTVELEELGGLLKRMPWTGAAFLVGSAAIVGLPPLNGFVSEFVLVYSGYAGVAQSNVSVAAAGLVTLVAMRLISGLAAACFAKAFGVVFLGTERSAEPEHAHEAARPMLAAMGLLALLCIAIGFAAPLIVPALSGIVAEASGLPAPSVAASLSPLSGALAITVAVFVGLTVLGALIWIARAWRLAAAGVGRGPVWGCGFQRPTPRMQYTASSFAQPLVTQFRSLVANREMLVAPSGYFPVASSYASDSGDPFVRLLFAPTFRWFDRVARRLNVIQHGHLHIYVLYIAATLIALLAWASL
ncbi:MAG TPA: proton-conducting transporter membrane subunit [Stellaceae bacterium]|nr:proton-conducting transporter membrane subunit [Stellaceae bacterium]